MGHTVEEHAFPDNLPRDIEAWRTKMPTIGALNNSDVVLVTYAEYVQPWLNEIYGAEAWSRLMVPVIARYDESFDRTDLGLHFRWKQLKPWAHYHSFPAAQDAEKMGGQWVPYGSDTHIFHPTATTKEHGAAFIGSLYPVRKMYLDGLRTAGNDLDFRVGICVVQDLAGIKDKESTELLAHNYRQIKVFFCLPPMSNLIVEKVVDVMASGTFVMYPRLFASGSDKNLVQFEDGKEIVYYDVGQIVENVKQIRYYLENETERETIARAGHERVLRDYTIEKMMEQILGLLE